MSSSAAVYYFMHTSYICRCHHYLVSSALFPIILKLIHMYIYSGILGGRDERRALSGLATVLHFMHMGYICRCHHCPVSSVLFPIILNLIHMYMHSRIWGGRDERCKLNSSSMMLHDANYFVTRGAAGNIS